MRWEVVEQGDGMGSTVNAGESGGHTEDESALSPPPPPTHPPKKKKKKKKYSGLLAV